MFTELMVACWFGQYDVCLCLCVSGVDVNEKDSWGRTALHYTAAGFGEIVAVTLIVKLLFNYNADMLMDDHGKIPLDYLTFAWCGPMPFRLDYPAFFSIPLLLHICLRHSPRHLYEYLNGSVALQRCTEKLKMCGFSSQIAEGGMIFTEATDYEYALHLAKEILPKNMARNCDIVFSSHLLESLVCRLKTARTDLHATGQVKPRFIQILAAKKRDVFNPLA